MPDSRDRWPSMPPEEQKTNSFYGLFIFLGVLAMIPFILLFFGFVVDLAVLFSIPAFLFVLLFCCFGVEMFNINDRVRLLDYGEEGVIVDIDPLSPYPYHVFVNGKILLFTEHEIRFIRAEGDENE